MTYAYYIQHTVKVPCGAVRMTDEAISSGMAFLTGELEKFDTRILEPLTSVTWPRDIVVKTGGGFIDYTSNFFANYGSAAPNNYGIIGGESNSIPVVQADISKDVFKVFTWANIVRVPFVEQQKMTNIGRSLEEIFNKGLRLNYDKTIDKNVYEGFSEYGTYGLINDPNVDQSEVDEGATSEETTWALKTPDEILYDINMAITATWAASEYDLSGMANHILIPPSQYADIVNRKISDAGTVSILTYLLENNIAKKQGGSLEIQPSRWCMGAGESSTDRMVAYVNQDDRVNFDMPVPLSRVFTQADAKDIAYLTPYVAQIGQVKILYTQCIVYRDGI